MNKNVPANLAAAVAALCAGTSLVVTRLAVGEIDPITLAFYRYGLGLHREVGTGLWEVPHI